MPRPRRQDAVAEVLRAAVERERAAARSSAEQHVRAVAHLSRVSTAGELAATLAHELNQPLTAVLANAQAAIRYLESGKADAGELLEILRDIVSDDRRACDIIVRLRAMLRNDRVEVRDLDLNGVVTDAVRLVEGEAAARGVGIDVALAPGLSLIRGDAVQLQQVVLNLVLNGMDAMTGVAPEERRVAVATSAEGARAVRVEVADRGTGIDAEALGHVFQPFFTTKSQGMGMGLSIGRTIVEAHGGSLAAENNPDRGATFVLRLPALVH